MRWMRFPASLARAASLALFAAAVSAGSVPSAGAADAARPLRQGDAIALGALTGVVTKFDSLPYVESEYSRRYKFDSYENPKLKELRERYHLDEVVAPGKTEFDRQVLLLDWVNHRLKKFGKPSSPARGALDVLAGRGQGNSFFCSHYGDVLVSAAASLGWIDRPLALRRPDGHFGSGGSTEHTSTEIWSDQYRKWVLFDPTFAMYMVKQVGGGVDRVDGVPLSAYEFRQEWFYHDGRDVVFVLDKDRKRYHKSDFPVHRGRYDGFGDLALDAGATDVYAFIGYVPNTDLMDRGSDWGRMFITRDKVCDGTAWHKRDNPADPANDPYFPINQAELRLEPAAPAGAKGQSLCVSLRVSLRTLTPNFKTYLARVDGGEWKPVGDAFPWAQHAGDNRLEVKSVNRFGIEGPVSVCETRLGDRRVGGARVPRPGR